jgi:tRNA-specific 2-thiouridylase
MPINSPSQFIAVALSGGVDSAVAAALLKEKGHHLIGITMTLPGNSAEDRGAEEVAACLGIPLHRIDMTAAFEQHVITPFVNSYLNGETPNPCVRCNSMIKFGLLLEHARSVGAERLATGHFARIIRDSEGKPHLCTAGDCRKDQSYFLAAIGQDALERVIFPLADLSGKDEVRRLAEVFGLPVADKKESQDVCFLNDDGYAELLLSRIPGKVAKGLIVHRSGKMLGRHNGFWRFTVGQRKGLGLAWNEPLYVLEVNAGRNRIVVGEERYLYSSGLVADELVWFGQVPQQSFNALCKIRYRHAPVPCRISYEPDGTLMVIFEEAQRAVTPGQTLVVYQGNEVLGAARIKKSISVEDILTD